MSISEDLQTARWGMAGFLCGVAALLMAVLLTSGMLAVEPEQSIGTTLGEIAQDIRLTATGADAGAPAEAVAPRLEILVAFAILAPILGTAAAVLGGISLYRHEPTTLPRLAIGLGMGAFVMQFAIWLALIVCGTVIVVHVLKNMDGTFGG